MKAFVKYADDNTITQGVLVKTNVPLSGDGWVEVPSALCCVIVDPSIDPTLVVNIKGSKKAWIKYDNEGNVVSSSTVVRATKPTSGIWKQVSYLKCC